MKLDIRNLNTLSLENAYDITKPLSLAERTYVIGKSIEEATGGRTTPFIIQDNECPRCLQCGSPQTLEGVCRSGCGIIKERMK